jgi:hypothetical protein
MQEPTGYVTVSSVETTLIYNILTLSSVMHGLLQKSLLTCSFGSVIM